MMMEMAYEREHKKGESYNTLEWQWWQKQEVVLELANCLQESAKKKSNNRPEMALVSAASSGDFSK